MLARATAAVLSAITIAGLVSACSGTDSRPAADGPQRPTVYAAASLAEVLHAITPEATYSFAGSDQLAFQIAQGAPADVLVSANPRYPRDLHARGLVETPVVVAHNSLVVVVPRANPAGIDSTDDLTRPGTRLVIGDPNVPVGEYTRTALARLGLRAALANVVSEEPDVRGVVAKVALGEADAGVVYRTDVRGERGRLRVIAIPPRAQPAVAYVAAVTTSARHPAEARAFVRRLLGPAGRRALAGHGFRPAG